MVNFAPKTLAEALEVLKNEDAVVYSGGTDLMLKPETERPYMFINRIDELKNVYSDEKNVYIGAGLTFTEALGHPDVPALLKEAVSGIAAPAIRNLGTFGGNLANGSAKADSALIFFVTDSLLRLVSARGERLVPIKDFYKGRKTLELQKDELIAEIIMPTNGISNYYYKKVGARSSLAISRVSFAGIMDVEAGRIKKCATAFGAVEAVVVRRPELDALLEGKTIEEAKAVKDAYLASFEKSIVPIKGRVSDSYRKAVCMNLLADFLNVFGV